MFLLDIIIIFNICFDFIFNQDVKKNIEANI